MPWEPRHEAYEGVAETSLEAVGEAVMVGVDELLVHELMAWGAVAIGGWYLVRWVARYVKRKRDH